MVLCSGGSDYYKKIDSLPKRVWGGCLNTVNLILVLILVSEIFSFMTRSLLHRNQSSDLLCISLCEKCTYRKLFWSAFSRIRTEYREILRIFSYSVRMQGNADQNNSEHERFLRSVYDTNLRHDRIKIFFLIVKASE